MAAIALDIANGAQGEDAGALRNKLTFADYFTRQVHALTVPYRADDIAAAGELLAAVTADPATIGPQQQAADAYLGLTVSVSGTLRAATLNGTDSDVNDANAPFGANNDFANAQPIGAPILLGGFVNRPFTGAPAGRSYASGDPADFFRVSLAAGDSIVLELEPQVGADGRPRNDLDLYLYNAARALKDASVGDGRYETLMPPAPGDYYLEVRAVAGASSYSLRVGQQDLSQL